MAEADGLTKIDLQTLVNDALGMVRKGLEELIGRAGLARST